VSLEKSVTGSAAGAVPAGTRYPIEYRVDGGSPVAATTVAGEPLLLENLPADATVQIREGAPPSVAGVEWGVPVWSAGDDVLPAGADGWVTIPLAAADVVTL